MIFLLFLNGNANLMYSSMSQKVYYFHLFTQHDLPHNYLLFFNDIQQPFSYSTLNTKALSFLKNLNLKFYIPSLPNTTSKEIMCRQMLFLSSHSELIHLCINIIHGGVYKDFRFNYSHFFN